MAVTERPIRVQALGKRMVFISHAHKDVRLAARFVDLLERGMGLPRTRCFASSLPLAKIPKGYDRHGFLKQCLTTSSVHIALVTPNFLRSADCNAELGYMWANRATSNVTFIPFVLKVSTRSEDLPWYLRDTELADLKDADELNALRDIIVRLAGTGAAVGTTEWNRECQQFTSAADALIADVPESIDYASMGLFIDACERFPRVLFFNVQVSFDDWFRPELQTHLALQDATTTWWQLDRVVDVNSDTNATRIVPHAELPDYYGTPTARVLFVTYERRELVKKLKDGDKDVQNFVDLALIHLFMATPLAVIAVDQLDRIMRSPPADPNRDDLDFTARKNGGYQEILHLPSATELDADKRTRLVLLKRKLDEMIMRPGDNPSAGIDFALLMQKRTPDGQPYEIWTGGITEDTKDMQYRQVIDAARRHTLYHFGKRIEHTVFRPLKEAQVEESPLLMSLLNPSADTEHERHKLARRLLAHRHPCFKVFHEASRDPQLRFRFARAMKLVWPDYCPLHIISEAGGMWRGVFDLSGE